MPASLGFDEYRAQLDAASESLAERADATGTERMVATCPGWSVATLLAHQGMVHRWARASLLGDKPIYGVEADVLDSVPPDQLLGWFHAGAEALSQTLAVVPSDIEAAVFLADAPAPREFWARRQAHETTMHAVDALAAVLGRAPTAGEVGLPKDFALDGIDELVRGFLPSGEGGMRLDEPADVAIAATDATRRWTLRVTADRIIADPEDAAEPDVVLLGTAAQLYLGLWNRGTEVTSTGRPDVLRRWHAEQHVRWSPKETS